MSTMGTSEGCRCGHCAGLGPQTPRRLDNRPGLPEVAYRTGTWASFRASMLAGLTRSDRPLLAGLRTRDPKDWSLALLDAWAVAADVLTFQTERTANEHYLRTATERRSVSGIVGLIGYRLSPGVAAQGTLAFTLDTSPGSPEAVPVASGAKVQTLPGPGQVPQTFETVEDLTALAGWNILKPRQTEPRVPQDGDTTLLLKGTATGVVRGATLLLVGDAATDTSGFATVRVTSVDVDAQRQETLVGLADFQGTLGAAGHVDIHLMRDRAALFGYNAASPVLFSNEVKAALGAQLTADDKEWAFDPIDHEAVDLDGVHEGLTEDSPVVVWVPEAGDEAHWVLAHLDSVGEVGRTAYGISAKVTRLALDVDEDQFTGVSTRETVLLLRAEPLTPAEVPIVAPVAGATIELDAPVPIPDVLPRRILLRGPAVPTDPTVEGETAQVTGEEVLVIAVDGPTLVLEAPLGWAYERATLEIWGNVATGTHGESVVDEVLGSGDAATTHQRFTLRRAPLTHTQAPTPSGGVSTLRVFVNDIEWTEVPTLFGRGPRDRVFGTTTTDDGATVVQFGDGVAGARPPTGRDNIRARYRTGTGLAGLADADQLSLLMTRPLGLKAVRNPFSATGAQDPEAAEDAADNAPRTVLTLDRVVSLRDVADFARGFGDIGKTAAVWTWDGQSRGVALTVGRIGGAAIDPADPLVINVTDALRAAGNARVPLVVLPAEVGQATIEAQLVLAPGFVVQPVLDAARAALLDHFSFARRDFGQAIALSEVDLVLHAVRGVTGVFVTRLHRTGEDGVRHTLLPARALVPGAPPPAEGAEVLTVDPETLDLQVAP